MLHAAVLGLLLRRTSRRHTDAPELPNAARSGRRGSRSRPAGQISTRRATRSALATHCACRRRLGRRHGSALALATSRRFVSESTSESVPSRGRLVHLASDVPFRSIHDRIHHGKRNPRSTPLSLEHSNRSWYGTGYTCIVELWPSAALCYCVLRLSPFTKHMTMYALYPFNTLVSLDTAHSR